MNLPTPEGVSPIMIAIETAPWIARLLIERGGNPTCGTCTTTALYLAVGNEGGGARRRRRRGGRGPAAGCRGAGAVPGRRAGPGAGAGSSGRAGAGLPPNNGLQVSDMEMVDLLLAAGVDPNPHWTCGVPARRAGVSTIRSSARHDAAAARADQQRRRSGAAAAREGRQSEHLWHGAVAIALCSRHQERHLQPNARRRFRRRRRGSVTVDTALLDLMLAGVDVNARVTGAASYSGRIARALTGDPVNTTSNEGMTALHVAVRSRNASLVATCLTRTRGRTSGTRRAGRRSTC